MFQSCSVTTNTLRCENDQQDAPILTGVYLDLEDETSKLGMEINEKKTKCMVNL